MKNLKRYIFEQAVTRTPSTITVDLIYQKLIDALDNAHIEFTSTRIEFHLGRVIKNSNIDINFIIRKCDSDQVRLGTDKSGDTVIVVDTTNQIPHRLDIDDFISTNSDVASGVKSALTSYLDDHKDAADVQHKTKYEDELSINDGDEFEDVYSSFAEKMNGIVDECSGIMSELEGKLGTENVEQREAYKRAIRHVVSSRFGSNVSEFKKCAMSHFPTDYTSSLSKENTTKLVNRLESMYDQRIKPKFH